MSKPALSLTQRDEPRGERPRSGSRVRESSLHLSLSVKLLFSTHLSFRLSVLCVYSIQLSQYLSTVSICLCQMYLSIVILSIYRSVSIFHLSVSESMCLSLYQLLYTSCICVVYCVCVDVFADLTSLQMRVTPQLIS